MNVCGKFCNILFTKTLLDQHVTSHAHLFCHVHKYNLRIYNFVNT